MLFVKIGKLLFEKQATTTIRLTTTTTTTTTLQLTYFYYHLTETTLMNKLYSDESTGQLSTRINEVLSPFSRNEQCNVV